MTTKEEESFSYVGSVELGLRWSRGNVSLFFDARSDKFEKETCESTVLDSRRNCFHIDRRWSRFLFEKGKQLFPFHCRFLFFLPEFRQVLSGSAPIGKLDRW